MSNTSPLGVTLDELKAIVHYDPETGLFTRLVASGARWPAGPVPGSVDRHGHVRLGILRGTFQGHRVAWFYMTGEWPALGIDHRNRVPNDNRWDNLRLATKSENGANEGLRKNNTSGFKGVTWSKVAGKWMAQIRTHGKKRYLGHYVDPADAAEAYRQAAAKHYGEFACDGRSV